MKTKTGKAYAVSGVVDNGLIRLPSSIHLSDGHLVEVAWEEGDIPHQPYDRNPISSDQVEKDLEWALQPCIPRR